MPRPPRERGMAAKPRGLSTHAAAVVGRVSVVSEGSRVRYQSGSVKRLTSGSGPLSLRVRA
jgi:hypothetical protein